jgi:hypothetical protein
MKRIGGRRPSASMVVAILALVVATSGGALAAGRLVNGDKLIAKHSLSGNRLRNHSISGAQINVKKLGAVPNANHANDADHATSADSATSANNATNAAHATDADHAISADSAPFVTTLPSHQTLRGAWDLMYAANAAFTQNGESFPFAVGSAPSGHVIPNGGPNPDPTDCPGTASNPQATFGQFCVYVTDSSNINTPAICDPTRDVCADNPSRFGFFLQANPSTASMSGHMVGTWAVTG